MTELKSLAFQVEQMRNAQKLYFSSIAKAKKTKAPGDFAAAANVLKTSKNLEIVVDDSIADYRKETEITGLGPNTFCVDKPSTCTMNYCDDNGCQKRQRVLVNETPTPPSC